MKRAFSSLTSQEALHVAVFIEERNAELYHRFAEMFVEFRDLESLEIASVFWDMAVEERQHSTMLQERYSERYGNASCALTEEDLQELIEVPRLEDGDVFSAATAGSNTTARERALQVALTAEQSARRYYAGLAENTTDTQLRKLYKELAEFEKDHIQFLEKKIQESPAKETGGGGNSE
jgi:rubrerythrin